jgi:ribosomal 50S subunit-recycling heat shock protein
MRLDKFLQVSRLVKRRALANELCDRGRVRVNGHPAKAASNVKEGDLITIAQGDRRLVAKVLDVPERPHPSKELVEVLSRLHVDELNNGIRDQESRTRK